MPTGMLHTDFKVGIGIQQFCELMHDRKDDFHSDT